MGIFTWSYIVNTIQLSILLKAADTPHSCYLISWKKKSAFFFTKEKPFPPGHHQETRMMLSPQFTADRHEAVSSSKPHFPPVDGDTQARIKPTVAREGWKFGPKRLTSAFISPHCEGGIRESFTLNSLTVEHEPQ